MKPADEERIAARLAKLMAMICVRNTGIEELHAGTVPVTHTGDYSDVWVTDADGRKIRWSDASHIDDDQMRSLMRQIVDRLYTFHLKADDPGFHDHLDHWLTVAERWDEPQVDENMIEMIPDDTCAVREP